MATTAIAAGMTIDGTTLTISNGNISAVASAAAAGSLTGTTLASNVVSSSLTSVGTITSGIWTGTTIAIVNGGTGATTAVNARTALLPTQSGKANLSLVTNGTDVDFTGNTVLQRVSTFVSTVATGTTQIPSDNTIPQNTEGDQYMSLAITPKSATSILVIDYQVQYTASAAGGYIAAPLFQDSTANALATSWASVDFSTFSGEGITGKWIMTSGTTSGTTFKVRAGPSTALTFTLNGVNGSGLYGGTSNSYIMITEYAA